LGEGIQAGSVYIGTTGVGSSRGVDGGTQVNTPPTGNYTAKTLRQVRIQRDGVLELLREAETRIERLEALLILPPHIETLSERLRIAEEKVEQLQDEIRQATVRETALLQLLATVRQERDSWADRMYYERRLSQKLAELK